MRRHLIANLIPVLLFPRFSCVAGQIDETERLKERRARGHQWPLSYSPDTPGWKAIHDRRLTQVAHISEGPNYKWNGYVETLRSAVTTPNFTETGWGLSRAPQELVDTLRDAIRSGLAEGRQRLERSVEVIEGPQAWFIDRPDLTRRVLTELKPMHEAWSGIDLEGNNAYGFRLYRNESALFMHVDKPDTHIISSILHIDRSEDAEPWPIVIEDYEGNTNEVILESGDILFYESSKCFHGRPKKFIGSWYTSIFTHYYPVGWDKPKRRLDAHYAVPRHWNSDPKGSPKDCKDSGDRCPEWAAMGECEANPAWMQSYCELSCKSCTTLPGDTTNIDRLVMAGTGVKEPDCVDDWCAFRDGTVKWNGPGEDGMVITTGKKFPLYENEEKDEL
mmetsp:Transcript_28060/g.82545  ORF Transcript_28060/g.82545 Transcript_28060/m.82545 type:complete len:390 (-) Transcript_28060:1279-2448(-)